MCGWLDSEIVLHILTLVGVLTFLNIQPVKTFEKPMTCSLPLFKNDRFYLNFYKWSHNYL